MKNKPFEMCMLFDFYGEMLTEKQKEAFDLYYNEDLSLSEIAENLGITRQGVRDAVMRSETILRDFELKLRLIEKYGPVEENLRKINQMARNISIINDDRYRNNEMQHYVLEIIDIATKLSSQ
ncbi:MAG: sigma factor-like helix-turn-helix DNA-binding protein [Clostridia bacterium]